MTVRAEIDNQDIVNVLRETRRRFPPDAVAHAAALSFLALIAGAACLGAYSAFSEIAAGGLSPARLVRSAAAPASASYIFLASLALAGLCAFGAFAAVGARRKAKRIALEEAQIAGIATGRFDYAFTAGHLVIQGPSMVRKIAWSAYDRIEETRSSIVFWKTSGGFDFIPKNVLKDKDFLATLEKNFGAAINRDLPSEETAHGNPLTITYELTPQDSAEYLAAYERKRFGNWRFLRRIPGWRPLAPFAFLILSFMAIAAFASALRNADVMLAAASIACGLIAAGVFIVHSDYFRGPAHPFRKKGAWPYAQSELVTVTLSQSGVYVRRQGVVENIQWRAVDHFLERRLTAYLVITPKKIVALPKRAFLSQEHFRRFSGYAKKCIKEAHERRAEEKQKRLMRSLKAKPAAAASSSKTPAKPAPQTKSPAVPQPAQARPRTVTA